MDYSDIVKVAEETDLKRVNAYLQTGRWRIIDTVRGQTESGLAYELYVLGWLGKCADDDTSEFPVPEQGYWAEPDFL